MKKEKSSKNKSYFSYGLNIESFIPLDGLLSSNSKPDVKISKGSVKESPFYKEFPEDKIIAGSDMAVRASKTSFCIEWFYTGGCLIENGKEVTVELDPRITDKHFEPLITGPISAILLHQQNKLVLHGSAVKMNDRAVVFLGDKGFGKSTIAAHLNARGHQLISDDLVPVSFSNDVAETVPGHPQIRLYSDSAESIGLNPDELPRVDERFKKRYIKLPDQLSTDPIKLGCIFVLNIEDEINITELKQSASFIELVRNTFLNRYIELTENSQEHFEKTLKIIDSIPIFQLNRPHDFGCIEAVVEKVEEHISKIII